MTDEYQNQLKQWQDSAEPGSLITCPACGYRFPNSMAIAARSTQGEALCHRCDKLMEWSKEVRVTFRTRLI